MNVPPSVRRNGTMYVHAFVMPAGTEMLSAAEWKVLASASLTKLAVPEAATFQLIGEADTSEVIYLVLLIMKSNNVVLMLVLNHVKR